MKTLILIATPGCEALPQAAAWATARNAAAQQDFVAFHEKMLGTPATRPAGWPAAEEFSRRLSAMVPRDPLEGLPTGEVAPLVLADWRAVWTAPASDGSCVFLAFYEHPRDFLARLAPAQNPRELLALWQLAAHAILRLTRRHPGRIVLVAWDEARRDPAALQALAESRFGVSGWPRNTAPEKVDPMSESLAWLHLRSAGVGAMRILDELRAASTPCAAAAETSVDPEVVMVRVWEGMASLASSRQSLEREVSTITEQRESALAELRVAASARDAALGELAKLHAEAARQTEELHRTQEEFEAYATKASADQAALESDLKAAKLRTAELETARAKTAAERDSLVEEKAAAESREISCRQAAVRANKENDLLLLQLHQVQEELESYFIRFGQLQEELERRPKAAPFLLEVERIDIGHIEPAPPHRHAEFSLIGTRLAGRDLGRVDMRLVEHHGKPGVAVFRSADSGAPAPLHHWKTHGREGDRDYMLLVCADEAGRDFFTAAPTSDLMLCREAVRLFAAAMPAGLASRPGLEPARWRRLAARFIALLDDLPRRVHYDHVEAKTAGPDTWILQMHQVWIPRCYRRKVELRWETDRLAVVCPRGEDPPLTNWPLDGAGELQYDLIVSASAPEDTLRGIWVNLTSQDRDWLCSVVAELPNLLHHIRQQHPEAKLDQHARLEAARRLKAFVKRLGPGRSSGWLARLARR